MIDTPQIDAAAELLWEHWNGGRRLAALPDVLRPSTRREGYAIQAQLERRTAFPLFGWKIAATSTAGQKHIGVDGPLAGRLLRERAFTTGDVVPFGRNHMRVAEAEFAFRMGADLLPRTSPYSTDEVRSAIDTLHPSIEIPDSRFDDFTTVGAPQLIADNACGHYFVLGPAASNDWRAIDLAAHRVKGTVESGGASLVGFAHADLKRSAPQQITRDGIGANVLGDPLVALTWLVNELSNLGIPTLAGEVITTGTCLTPLDIAPGDHVVMDFGPLGRVEATMAADA